MPFMPPNQQRQSTEGNSRSWTDEKKPRSSNVYRIVPGADLGGAVVTMVTNHPPPGAAAYFMLSLCV